MTSLRLCANGSWASLVGRYLAHLPRVTPSDVDRAEQWAANSSMFEATASYRLKIIGGVPWLRLLRIHSHWAERANVLRLLLIAVELARPLPDFELVYIHNDRDPTPRPFKRCHQGDCSERSPLPLFTNARRTIEMGGIPLPDFTWLGWRNTPPWCKLSARLSAHARENPWYQRDGRAFFSGGLDNGAARKALRLLYHSSRRARDILSVRDVDSGKWMRWKQFDTANRSGILPPKQAVVPPEEACKHKYALSLPGFGYSSRLRALLACGSLVLHAQHDNNEFFMPCLQDGKHLVKLRGSDAVSHRLLPTLKRVMRDPASSERIAAAGQLFSKEWLSHDAVMQYVVQLIKAYARRFSGTVSLEPDYLRLGAGNRSLEGNEELSSAMGLCLCVGPRPRGSRSEQWRESRRKSAMCMAQGKGHRCRPWAPPGGGRCFAPKCCEGWDCGISSIDC